MEKEEVKKWELETLDDEEEMEEDFMFNNMIVSYNLNSWKPISDVCLEEKIEMLADYLFDSYGFPSVIELQEVIAGRDEEHLAKLEKEFADYHIIPPPAFDHKEHSRSLINTSLIHKSLSLKEVRPIGTVLPNRIYDTVVTYNNIPVHILNCYMVQVQNFHGKAKSYIKERNQLHMELWSTLLAAAEELCDDYAILVGDFQENSKTGKHIAKLFEMGYKEKAGGEFPTVRNDFFKEKCIDHIFYSAAAYDLFAPRSFTLDGGLDISDHCLLVSTNGL